MNRETVLLAFHENFAFIYNLIRCFQDTLYMSLFFEEQFDFLYINECSIILIVQFYVFCLLEHCAIESLV